MTDLFAGADWVTGVLAFLAVFLGALSLVLVLELVRGWWVQRRVRTRLGPLLSGDSSKGEGLLRTADDAGPLERVLSKFSATTGLGSLLRESQSSWSLAAFIVISLALATGTGVASVFVTRSIFGRIPLMVMAAIIPYVVLRIQRRRRLDAFEAGLPEAIDLLGRAIRAGHPLSSGVQMVGNEAPEPVAEEFRNLFEEQRFGIPIEEALAGMVDRVDLVDVRIFSTAVLVQREVGGNLAELLDRIARTMRERFSIRRQLRVYTAQGRLSGYVLCVMPFVVGTGLWLLDPDYMGELFYSFVGRFFLAAALILWFFGFIWIRQIVNIDI